jgi:hypothetical protein
MEELTIIPAITNLISVLFPRLCGFSCVGDKQAMLGFVLAEDASNKLILLYNTSFQNSQVDQSPRCGLSLPFF